MTEQTTVLELRRLPSVGGVASPLRGARAGSSRGSGRPVCALAGDGERP